MHIYELSRLQMEAANNSLTDMREGKALLPSRDVSRGNNLKSQYLIRKFVDELYLLFTAFV